MKLLRLLGVYSIFLHGCLGNKWEKGEYKESVFISIDSDRLIKNCYGMYSADSCLRHRSQREHQWRDWSYKMWVISNVIFFSCFGTSVLFMPSDFMGTISIIEIKRLVKVQVRSRNHRLFETFVYLKELIKI